MPITDITSDHCRSSRYPEIKELADYAGEDARGFGIVVDGDVLCACWYWYGERYARDRDFWPLREREAKLVQITTAEHARGHALARKLIIASARTMQSSGFEGLFARIWYGHKASESAFKAAGWRRIGMVVTFHMPLFRRLVRLRWPPLHFPF